MNAQDATADRAFLIAIHLIVVTLLCGIMTIVFGLVVRLPLFMYVFLSLSGSGILAILVCYLRIFIATWE